MKYQPIPAAFRESRILSHKFQKIDTNDGWEGTIELEFPNTDGVMIDRFVVNSYKSCDKLGNTILWDMPIPEILTTKLNQHISTDIRGKICDEIVDGLKKFCASSSNKLKFELAIPFTDNIELLVCVTGDNAVSVLNEYLDTLGYKHDIPTPFSKYIGSNIILWEKKKDEYRSIF